MLSGSTERVLRTTCTSCLTKDNLNLKTTFVELLSSYQGVINKNPKPTPSSFFHKNNFYRTEFEKIIYRRDTAVAR